MPDITAIAHALSSLKAAKDIAEAMIGLRDTAAFQGKLLEFQSKLIDANNAAFAAQDERSAMLERIGELEKEVARLKAWETEKQRYELKELRSGAFARSLKEEEASREPPHNVCANCYERGQKFILQQEIRFPGRASVAVCHGCGAEIYLTGGWEPAHTNASHRTKS
jgi:predicted P-loop ATPase